MAKLYEEVPEEAPLQIIDLHISNEDNKIKSILESEEDDIFEAKII
jgi:hypothetical protein